MNLAIRTAIESWSPPFLRITMLVVALALYSRGFTRLHRQMPLRFPLSRLAYFSGGIAALWIAIASPLEQFDDLLLQVHMVQHLLLMLVAPILLLAGAPAIPLVRALPVGFAKAVVGPVSKSRSVRAIFRWLTEPLVCWLAFTLATWGWHAPAAFDLALRSENVHALEHACFFTTALMFWWPVIQPWPSVPRWPRWTMLPYLLFADVQNTALAALFIFTGKLLYPFYASAPRIAGISPLDDQIMAGMIMWVPASLFYLIPGVIILFRYLSPRNLVQPVSISNSQSRSANMTREQRSTVC